MLSNIQVLKQWFSASNAFHVKTMITYNANSSPFHDDSANICSFPFILTNPLQPTSPYSRLTLQMLPKVCLEWLIRVKTLEQTADSIKNGTRIQDFTPFLSIYSYLSPRHLDMGFLPNIFLPAIQTAISNLPAKTAIFLLCEMYHTKL